MKILKSAFFFIGNIVFALVTPAVLILVAVNWYTYLLKFFAKYTEIPAGAEVMATLSSIITAIYLIAYFAAWLDSIPTTKTNLTKHSCDICGETLEKGKGEHKSIDAKEPGKCFCICETCLPTHKGML